MFLRPDSLMSLLAGLFSGVLVAAVLLFAASPILYRGVQLRRRYHRLRDLPVETPATATPGETALVTGTAEAPESGTVPAPLSDGPAVFAGWVVHELVRTGTLGAGTTWAPDALGADTRGFVLREGEDTVAVSDWSRESVVSDREQFEVAASGWTAVNGIDADGLFIEVEAFDTESRVRPGETPPGPLRRLSSRVGHDTDDSAGRLLPPLPRIRTPEGTLRYRETVVRPGKEVTVLGTVREPEGDGESLRLEAPDQHRPLVTPLSPAELRRRYRRTILKGYALVALLLTLAAALGLAVAL